MLHTICLLNKLIHVILIVGKHGVDRLGPE